MTAAAKLDAIRDRAIVQPEPETPLRFAEIPVNRVAQLRRIENDHGELYRAVAAVLGICDTADAHGRKILAVRDVRRAIDRALS